MRVNLLLRMVGLLGRMLVLAVVVAASGCASIQALLEVPSLENQVNRVVSGLDAVRTNEVIANMPVSSDAKWPAALAEERTEENERLAEQLLQKDPYIATHEYTDELQKEALGGLFTPKVGELVYSNMNRFIVLYGIDEGSSDSEWPKHWPSAFSLGSNIAAYNEFENKGSPKRVDAIKGNLYQGYADAVIALMPTNFQKDLKASKKEMDESLSNVLGLKAKIGELEVRLENDPDENGNSLSDSQRMSINDQIYSLTTEMEQKDVVYQEHEEIYFTQLNDAVEFLKSDINLADGQVELAKNISLVAEAIYAGAGDAGQAFGSALLNISTRKVIEKLPLELQSLNEAKRYVPRNKVKLFDKRYTLLAENGLYALPAIAMGSYYAAKQAYRAGKYADIAEVILEADQARKEAESEAVEANQETVENRVAETSK